MPQKTDPNKAVERLVKPSPKHKPPRKDLKKERIDDLDPDLDDKDPDLSLNYKDIGGSMQKNAVYWGIKPYRESQPYRHWSQEGDRTLDDQIFEGVVATATDWLSTQWAQEIDNFDSRLRAALDHGLKAHKVETVVHPTVYDELLSKLEQWFHQNGGELGVYDSINHIVMANKDSVNVKVAATDSVLSRLDRVAQYIQQNHKALGLKFKHAKQLVNHIDKTADLLETASYGKASMQKRIAKVMNAEVVQRDADEAFMDTFDSPFEPHQIDADEAGYMNSFEEDRTSEMQHGRMTTGRPLVGG